MNIYNLIFFLLLRFHSRPEQQLIINGCPQHARSNDDALILCGVRKRSAADCVVGGSIGGRMCGVGTQQREWFIVAGSTQIRLFRQFLQEKYMVMAPISAVERPTIQDFCKLVLGENEEYSLWSWETLCSWFYCFHNSLGGLFINIWKQKGHTMNSTCTLNSIMNIP